MTCCLCQSKEGKESGKIHDSGQQQSNTQVHNNDSSRVLCSTTDCSTTGSLNVSSAKHSRNSQGFPSRSNQVSINQLKLESGLTVFSIYSIIGNICKIYKYTVYTCLGNLKKIKSCYLAQKEGHILHFYIRHRNLNSLQLLAASHFLQTPNAS